MKNRIYLKILLMVNGLMEGGFGIYLLVFPGKMCGAIGCSMLSHASFSLVSRMYGLAALCLGILSLGLFIRRIQSDFLAACLLVFGIFHLGMAVIQYIDNPFWQAGLIHIVLGPLFLFSYFKERPTGQENLSRS